MRHSKIAEYLGIIKSLYPYAYKEMTEIEFEKAVKLWAELLGDYNEKLVDCAFKEVLKIAKVPPVPADIIEVIGKLETINEPTDAALWDECASLIYELQDKFYCAFHFGHNPVEEKKYKAAWDNANEIVKEFLGTASNAVSINTETLDFEKSRFYKALPTIRKRVRDKRKLENLSISASDLKIIGRNGETEI